MAQKHKQNSEIIAEDEVEKETEYDMDSQECDCQDQNKTCNCTENGEPCDCKNPEHKHDANCNCTHSHSNKSHKESDIAQETLYYLDLAQRLKADFDNYRKRNEDIAKQSYNSGISYAVEKMLNVIDTITQAKLTISDQATLQGFEMISTQFLSSLESLGIKKIESVGQQFNPNLHNAVLTEQNPKLADQVVTQEFQMGFILGEKVVRHSVVKINKL